MSSDDPNVIVFFKTRKQSIACIKLLMGVNRQNPVALEQLTEHLVKFERGDNISREQRLILCRQFRGQVQKITLRYDQ